MRSSNYLFRFNILLCLILAGAPVFGQWVEKSNGIYGGAVTTMTSSGTTLYAGTARGVYKSTDNATTWTLTSLDVAPNYLETSGGNVVASATEGAYYSGDNGTTWTKTQTIVGFYNVTKMKATNSGLFAAAFEGVFVSNNNGQSWQKMSNGIPSTNMPTSFATNGTTLFVGLSNGTVYQSTNGGSLWSSLGTATLGAGNGPAAMLVSGGELFAASSDVFGSGGVYKYGLLNWENVTNNLFAGSGSKLTRTIVTNGTAMFAGGYGIGSTTNGGTNWTNFSTGIQSQYNSIHTLAIVGGELYAGYQNGVLHSANMGTNWTSKSNGITAIDVNSLIKENGKLFAGSYYGLYTSVDNGDTWLRANNMAYITGIRAQGSTILAGTLNGGAMISIDNGTSWSSLVPSHVINNVITVGSNFFFGSSGGVYVVSHDGTTWVATPLNSGLEGTGVKFLGNAGSILFASTETDSYRSDNMAASWTKLTFPGDKVLFRGMVTLGSDIYAGSGSGVHKSTNNGASWTRVGGSTLTTGVNSLAIKDNQLIAATSNGIYFSNDAGTTWALANNGLAKVGGLTLLVDGDIIMAGTSFGVWKRPIAQLSADLSITHTIPEAGYVGTKVTLFGANFSPTAAGNVVKFNGIPATVLTNPLPTSTQITVVVPFGAASGKITIEVNGQTFTTRSNFGISTDSSPPVLSADNTPPTVPHGTDLLVDVDVVDTQAGLTEVVLQYRGFTSSSKTFVDAPMTKGTGDSWKATIEAKDISDLGLVYRVLMKDFVGNTGTSTEKTVRKLHEDTGLPIVYSSFGKTQASYRIVALPLLVDKSFVKDIFEDELGEYDDKVWRMFRYDNSKSPALFPLSRSSPLVPGEGYWFISSKEVPAISTGPGSSVALVDDAFEITLNKGWNQIGNPFNFNISWTDVLNANPAIKSHLGQTARTWDGSVKTTDVIKKSEGAYISFTGNALTRLKIPSVKNPAINGRKNSPVLHPIDHENWQVLLKVRSGSLETEYSGIGMHKNAHHDVDEFDDFNTPRFFEFAEILHPQQLADMSFAKDIRPTAAEHTWEFSLVSNTQLPLTLSWSNEHFGENDKQLLLVDIAGDRVIDMRLSESVTFDNVSKRPLKIVFGDRAFVERATLPEKLNLSLYPNPFSQDITTEISLPGDAFVQLTIHDIHGRLLKTLITAQQRHGRHAKDWSEEISSLPEGLYIFRLATSEEVKFVRAVKHQVK